MKVIIFDIDGTLIGKNKEIDTLIVDQIDSLKSLGYKVGIATGRSLIESKEVIALLKPNFPTILYDGNLIVDSVQSKLIYRNPLIFEDVKHSLDLLKREECHFIYEETNKLIVEDKRNELLIHLAFGIPRDHIEVVKKYCGNPLKIYIYKRDKIFNLNRLIDNTSKLEIFYAGDKWATISKIPMNKFEATKILCKKFGIAIKEVIAFGDGLNDLELIKNVGLGVAMYNSSDLVKSHAKLIADHVDDKGVSEILSNIITCSRLGVFSS